MDLNDESLTEDDLLQESGSEDENEIAGTEVNIGTLDNTGVKVVDVNDEDVKISTSDDNFGACVSIISDSDVQEAAKHLLLSKAPKITLEYRGITYTMFKEPNDFENESKLTNNPADKYILKSFDGMHVSFTQLFESIRGFLQTNFGTLEFLSKEIILTFPDLQLTVNEDNTYAKNITMNDIESIFKILRDNSLKRGDDNIPDHLHAVVTLGNRFVSKYNDLVELVDNDASFAHVNGFSNDQQHPLILDGNESYPSKTEVVLESSGDEELLEINN
ncbi:HGR112Cp [Eremothecium sinecaudum]|uniref:HGR112Cp n=1 Tax=Eremothecium sinecaudum TaxID=45286 RepID=A0A0X8HVF4_9SACH|nr:HGR112Cp [Eremothecium sinecaudum]AMD22451.1 HGR112Cp [Eremothecium sinecaudum]